MKPVDIEGAEDVLLDLIDLPLEAAGVRNFFGIWLIRDTKRGFTAIVDVGPASTVPILLGELSKLGVKHLDYILLSHIHLDHSAGLADVLREFPSAKVAVHPKGVRHLVDPERLWTSSLQVIPKMARAYGKPSPVDKGAFLTGLDGVPGITALETPGHAPHHLSFIYKAGGEKILFAGEAASTYNDFADLVDGANCGRYLLRPASPPRFYLEEALGSLENLKRENATLLCYAHFGSTRNVGKMLGEAGEQLLLWRELFLEYVSKHPETTPEGDLEGLGGFVIEKDPWLAGFYDLPDEIQKREMGFLLSTAAGFLEAVAG